ncbi:uncharacterized protein DEA37_0014850 [Paragonimus westermani]|uniref:Uncharacterized protein n=1 Tax=Paragonimus westermani TaxID=34504 RepID=A0A5J4NXD3_9TREM|nr:uncharacterized protein DEA37_0014850 [Paragonimus westermani]
MRGEENDFKIGEMFAELRGQLTAYAGQVDELERLLHAERNVGLTTKYGLNTTKLRNRMHLLQRSLADTEASLKRELGYIQECESTLTQASLNLLESQDELTKLKQAVQKASRHEIPKLYKLIQALSKKHEDNKLNVLQASATSAENLLAVSQAQNCQFVPGAQAKITRNCDPIHVILHPPQLNELNEGYEQHQEELRQLASELMSTLGQIELADEMAKQADEWLSAQEQRLNKLRSGPATYPLSLNDASSSPSKDCIQRHVALHKQWVEQCQSNATDARKQLTALQSLANCLHSANQWLSTLQNDYSTLSGDHVPPTTDLSGLTDVWDQQYRELDKLLQRLSATGESHKTSTRQAMEPLVSPVVGRQYDTTALVMVARRELADFQTELGRLQRQLEADFNEVCDV